MSDDAKIFEAARYSAIEAELQDIHDDNTIERLASMQDEIERALTLLVPTTAEAAIEQIEILIDHDDAGIRALKVLRAARAGEELGMAVRIGAGFRLSRHLWISASVPIAFHAHRLAAHESHSANPVDTLAGLAFMAALVWAVCKLGSG